MNTPFDPDTELVSPSLYTLNLSAAQRCALSWMEDHGAYWAPIVVPVAQVAEDCGNSTSTVYEALARLEGMKLILRDEAGLYLINPKVFFTLNKDLRTMVANALVAPDVVPDERALAPRKVSNTEARRRKVVRAV